MVPTLARATWFTGTIFAVYEKTSPGIGTTADILRTGNDIVAAGYCMYGAATELVICFKGSGVERFALDPSLGEFIHTHTNVQFPVGGGKKIYSCNEVRHLLALDIGPRAKPKPEPWPRPQRPATAPAPKLRARACTCA